MANLLRIGKTIEFRDKSIAIINGPKCVSAYHAELQLHICAYPYWDSYVNEHELLARKETRVAALAEKLGPRTLVKLLHVSQTLLNFVPPLRSQGNKFLCAISKGGLHP